MTHSLKSTPVVLSLGLLMSLASGSVLADSGSAAINSADAIVVVSNGSSYTQTQGSQLAVGGKLQYSTGTAGRVKSWQAWPILHTGFGSKKAVGNTQFWGGQSKNYPVGSRPKSLNLQLGLSLPMSLAEPFAVDMCNAKAASLKSQGLSNTQIFSQDHQVHFNASMGYKVDAGGAGSNNAIWEYSSPHKVLVKCARTQAPAAPGPGAGIESPGTPVPGYKRSTQPQNAPKRRNRR